MNGEGRGPGVAEARVKLPGPAFQVIVLGSGGGPNEDNVTGLLVRSTAKKWSKGSVLAVDAGTHLASIVRILEHELAFSRQKQAMKDTDEGNILKDGRQKPNVPRSSRSSRAISPRTTVVDDQTLKTRDRLEVHRDSVMAPPLKSGKPTTTLLEGPFQGVELPFESAKANAAYITREFISTYLITHPHLDHISGFVVNTASFQNTSRPKRLAALPSTINAIKTHIFNDIIWPNLSDEDHGVGLVSYMRLVDGGNVALGEGEGRGYIEVCDGLGVKTWSVSHGHCMKTHSHRGNSFGEGGESAIGRLAKKSESWSIDPPAGQHTPFETPLDPCVIDSSAFFIRDDESGMEVLIFGDVEPDSLSLSPRTAQIWTDAANKIAADLLTGIFIECSYDDSQPDETLFGHLAPRHLISELKLLAEKVTALRAAVEGHGEYEEDTPARRKRKRQSNGLKMHLDPEIQHRRSHNPHQAVRRSTRGKSNSSPGPDEDIAPDERHGARNGHDVTKQSQTVTAMPGEKRVLGSPLRGLKVVIMHVKDTFKDGPPVEDSILAQLLAYERDAELGCEFLISKAGVSIYL
ncbi:MAG: 3',5'-cyclic-nucleotide phosphodiesterase pde1 [Pycnora praestabilis]|nr:MAG: 3',5'-cyclic-nucleotide phosphodiesterase pde1 [Pycnora praestabilis]